MGTSRLNIFERWENPMNTTHWRNTMKSYARLVCCIVALMVLLGQHLVLAEKDPEKLMLPVGTMTLAAPPDSEREPQLSPVVFPHSLHFAYSCKDCHHEWDGTGPVQSCAAAGCHENLWAASPGTTPLGEKRIKSLTGAYHQTCRDCHRNELKAQKAAGMKRFYTGPIACEGCHPEPHADPVNEIEWMSVPLGTLTIAPPDEVDAKRPAVEFPHGLHFDYACQRCHHEWDGESDVEGCMADGCHDQFEPDESTRNINDPANVYYYLAAYHNTCLPCHRETTQERKALEKAGITNPDDLPAAGPVACIECH
jgi:hypothetical protein